MHLSKVHVLQAAIATVVSFGAFSCPLEGQTFAPIPALSFTKAQAGANPLPQVLTIASAAVASSNLSFTATWSTASGGSWLSLAGLGCSGGNGGCGTTPQVLTAIVNASPTLAAGAYTGQIVIDSGKTSITVPVTLNVGANTSAYFDTVQGGMSFSLKTAGKTPPAQTVQLRNGGSGTLNLTLTPSTSDGGNWLTASSPNGTAPSMVTVGLKPGSLPGGGLVAGTFVGLLAFQTTGSAVTIPVSVTVGDSVLSQVNGIAFTKPFAGGNPLPQVLTFAGTGANIAFTATWSTSTGGNWLSVDGLGCSGANGGCGTTPQVLTAIVNASPTLAAGTYTGQIVIDSVKMAITVPVTLTVGAPSDTFFDSLPGQMSFTLKTAGTTITPQSLQIRNAGAGTLNWSLTTNTSDGANWLSVSTPNGTAPSSVTVSVIPGALPNAGLIAGTFTGELVFQTGGISETVPVSVVVGDSVFSQVNAIAFTKPFAGADPLPQVLTFPGTGAKIAFTATWFTSSGGNWLSVEGLGCSGGNGGCGTTPQVLTAVVHAGIALAAGTYSGQIVINSDKMAITVPVTLTVGGGGAVSLFDNLPGQMSFSMKTAGSAPPAQSVQVRNAGTGALNWTLAASTFDGGNWLNVAPLSGTAPSTVTVTISPNALPSGGLVAGTFTGGLTFQTSGGGITIPISVVVGDNVFNQISAINLTKPFAGANPLPQTLNVTSTGAKVAFTAEWSTATGGNWLSVDGLGCSGGNGGCGTTPQVLTAHVNAPPTMPAGIYTGQIVVNSGPMAMTVPVNLTVTSSAPNVEAVATVFLGNAGFSSNTYLTLYGSNLATTTRDWSTAFSSSNAPTTLDGVSVTVNNIPAFIQYVSPGQININTPDDTATGPVVIQVRSASGNSSAFSAARTRLSPSMLSAPQFNANGKNYVVAQTPDFSTFIGPPNLIQGVGFSAAKPGSTVIIFAIGCGPTTPATPAGVLAAQNSPLALPFQVNIGGVAATVPFAGLLAGTVGLYQLNVVVPAVPAGDQTIELIVDSVPNAQSLTLRVGP
jgi:uncharacterized protein (TIGR03437 family)